MNLYLALYGAPRGHATTPQKFSKKWKWNSGFGGFYYYYRYYLTGLALLLIRTSEIDITSNVVFEEV